MKKDSNLMSKKENNKNESLTTNDLFRLADLHFYKKNYIFKHLYDSYNKFIDEDVKNYLENEEHIFTEFITYSQTIKYLFKFENVRIQEPMLDNGIEPLFPAAARHHNLTYSLKVYADVTQYQDIYDILSDEKKQL